MRPRKIFATLAAFFLIAGAGAAQDQEDELNGLDIYDPPSRLRNARLTLAGIGQDASIGPEGSAQLGLDAVFKLSTGSSRSFLGSLGFDVGIGDSPLGDSLQASLAADLCGAPSRFRICAGLLARGQTFEARDQETGLALNATLLWPVASAGVVLGPVEIKAGYGFPDEETDSSFSMAEVRWWRFDLRGELYERGDPRGPDGLRLALRFRLLTFGED